MGVRPADTARLTARGAARAEVDEVRRAAAPGAAEPLKDRRTAEREWGADAGAAKAAAVGLRLVRAPVGARTAAVAQEADMAKDIVGRRGSSGGGARV